MKRNIIISDDLYTQFDVNDELLKQEVKEQIEEFGPPSVDYHGDEFLDMLQEWVDIDWDTFGCLINTKEYNTNNYLVIAGLDLWDGMRHGFGVFEGLKNTLFKCFEDYNTIYRDDDNNLCVSAVHHDGRNEFTMKLLTDKGYKFYQDHVDDEPEFENAITTSEMLKQLISNPEFSCIVVLPEEFGG